MGRLFLAALGIVSIAAISWAADPQNSSSEGTTSKSVSKSPGGAGAAELKSDKQKGSYSIGFTIGTNVRRQVGPELDAAAFLLGFRESLLGKEPSLSDREREAALMKFTATLREKQMGAATAAADVNKKKGNDFLAANKAKPGVKTLPSGVQYVVLKEGSGKKPLSTDSVEVHYHGTLLSGKVFDSSVDRGEPATFQLDKVIKGWTEVVQLMKEGSKWRVFIPPDSAYGARGTPGGPIGPNETLIFEIELRKVN